MKYMIGIHDDCYIDVNGTIHIPFPDRLIKEADKVKQRLGSWPNGGYRYDTRDIMVILYGRIAELEQQLAAKRRPVATGDIEDCYIRFNPDE